MSATSTEVLIQPRLLDRAGMAAAICLSVDVLDRLRKMGMPCINVPTTSKTLFDPDAVVGWLREQSESTGSGPSLARAAARADAIFGGN